AAADQFGRQRWQAVILVLSEAVHDRHVLALDVAGVFEALAKSAQPVRNRVRQLISEEPDRWHRQLLCSSRERPRHSTAKKTEKFPPPHGSFPLRGTHATRSSGVVQYSKFDPLTSAMGQIEPKWARTTGQFISGSLRKQT